MKFSFYYFLVLASILGCEKNTIPSQSFEKEVNVLSAPNEGVKEFVFTAPFVLKDGIGNQVIEMTSDKQVFVKGKHVADLDSEGNILSPDGNVIAKLNRGNILVDKFQMPLIKLKEDGTVDYGSGIVLHWSKEGELLQGNEELHCSIQPVKKNH